MLPAFISVDHHAFNLGKGVTEETFANLSEPLRHVGYQEAVPELRAAIAGDIALSQEPTHLRGDLMR